MKRRTSYWRLGAAAATAALAAAWLAAGMSSAATADHFRFDGFRPGNLVVSRSIYVGSAGLVTPGVTELPPGCTSGTAHRLAAGTDRRRRHQLLVEV
jgi:hypothetical protein